LGGGACEQEEGRNPSPSHGHSLSGCRPEKEMRKNISASLAGKKMRTSLTLKGEGVRGLGKKNGTHRGRRGEEIFVRKRAVLLRGRVWGGLEKKGRKEEESTKKKGKKERRDPSPVRIIKGLLGEERTQPGPCRRRQGGSEPLFSPPKNVPTTL